MAHPNIHVTFTGVLDAPRGTLGLPALDYAKATQYLTPVQQQALNALLRTFVEHPRYATPERYLQATADGLEGRQGVTAAEILGEADDEDNFTPHTSYASNYNDDLPQVDIDGEEV